MNKIRNPILRGFKPDPSICKGKDAYYLVVSSFEYYPLIPIYKSKDLINWELINYAVTNDNMGELKFKNVPDSQGIFAPTIRYYNDKYYILCTVFNTNIKNFTTNFMVTANNPHDKWSDPHILDIEGIDPSIYLENNTGYIHYASWTNENISAVKQVEINLDTYEISKPIILTYGNGGRDPEAPHIYFKDSFYYLLLAEGGTREGHMITIFRSNNVNGPYVSYGKNPILTHRDLANHPFQNIGHGDLIKKGNDWYLLMLGIRPKGMFKHNLGRETFIKKINWENDWPKIEGSVNLFEEIDVKQKRINHIKYDFSQIKEIPNEFNTIRDHLNDNAYIVDEHLVIKANQSKIDDKNTPALLLLRQKEYNFNIKVIINLEKSKGENGFIILNGSENYFKLMIIKNSSNLKIKINKKCYDLVSEEERKFKNNIKDLTIFLKGDQDYYSYSILNNDKETVLSKMKRELLSTEVSNSPFTGVLFGPCSEIKGSIGYFKLIEINYYEEEL